MILQQKGALKIVHNVCNLFALLVEHVRLGTGDYKEHYLHLQYSH